MCASMTPKERAHLVLEHKEPDRIPLIEAWLSDVVIERVLQRPFKGTVDIVDFYRKLEIDFACISFGSPIGWEKKFLDESVFLDEWGRKWQYLKGGMWGGYGMYIDGTIKTPEQLDEYEFPNANAPGRMDAFETSMRMIGNDYAVTGTIDEGIFQRAALMTGLKEFLIYLYENPSFVRELLKRHYEFALEIGKQFIEAGAEFILHGDDVADNHGPFLPPKLYEEFVYPYDKALTQSLKKRGARVIRHSDGKLIPLMSYFLDMGVDAIAPVGRDIGMSIAELKRNYGNRLSFAGGVDIIDLLPFGSEDDVEKEVVRIIREASSGGGLILGSSNSLHTYVPDLDKLVRNVFKYVQTAHKSGVYPITS